MSATKIQASHLAHLASCVEAIPESVHSENCGVRLRQTGAGAELVRQAYIRRLKPHIDAFYEHGTLADLVALCNAFEEIDADPRAFKHGERHSPAPLLEAILTTIGLSAQAVVGREMEAQRSPGAEAIQENMVVQA